MMTLIDVLLIVMVSGFIALGIVGAITVIAAILIVDDNGRGYD